ncbi:MULTISPECIES: hypothetical protein [Bacillus cereus group]|uniref:Uncharacterized protein n=2 Tax=Bacillaceae TaxID=186817 RepID=A0A9W3X6R3_BACTU|nr:MULTISPECIES: hypothetical protein [Bacillus cereus group]AOM08916.1 hypothetical protein BTI247_04630 [Bacillus thuringiensis Bt18247]MBG9525183.1 hypothetical protein [Bacillus thuringiensis]NKW92559.1 hypothetical protein [Bacillus toyonensis]NSL65362.1 hypothetical protein [Bacillus toyonensis]PEK38335.1 hypothetical protein CN897_01560 [Bacillus toyonensis]
MIETIIVKWYCKHCDSFNRTEVRAKGNVNDEHYHGFCKKCNEQHYVVMSVQLEAMQPVEEEN